LIIPKSREKDDSCFQLKVSYGSILQFEKQSDGFVIKFRESNVQIKLFTESTNEYDDFLVSVVKKAKQCMGLSIAIEAPQDVKPAGQISHVNPMFCFKKLKQGMLLRQTFLAFGNC